MRQRELDAFVAWMLERGRSEGTARLYATHLRLSDDEKTLTTRLLSRRLSPNTRRTILASLRAYGRWRGDAALLAELEDLKLPAAARVSEKRPLLRDEWDLILEACESIEDTANRASLRMICTRGFRVGDVCRITRRDLERAARENVLVYEAKAGRFLRWGHSLFRPSIDELLSLDRGWMRIRDLLCPDARDETRQRAARLKLSRQFRILEERAGLEAGSVTPHRMRRTYAVYFLKASGGDLAALQQHMGWASLNTALQYVDHARAEELDAIAMKMREGKK